MYAEEEQVVEEEQEEVDPMERKIMEQIMQILDHYKQEDPVGLPNAPVQDPMEIPDLSKFFSLQKMEFKSVKVYGLSKFRIVHIRSNLADMEVSVGMSIDQLLIKGKYRLSSFFQSSSGPFTVTLDDVFITGIASLEVNRDGKLEAQDINMDITFQNIALNFENLGFMGSIFQVIINSVGSFLFDSIKPFILSKVNTNVRGDMNKHIMEIPQTFPNSIPPLDMAVAELRKYVRTMNFDPYLMDNFNHSAGIFALELTHIWLNGLATFHRVGNITIFMENNTAHFGMSVGTRRLKGSCHWEVGVAGLLSRGGTVSFTTEYIQAEVQVAQALDVRKKPKLEDFNLRLGNIQVRMDGAGSADYVVELVVNVIPNLLRYQIIDLIEGPVRQKIQTILDQLDVEEQIQEYLPKVYKFVSEQSVVDNNL
ncbi:UNVERIFIED_CONTAM: hypothetical protein PYX00_000431 [Menopon gallinae]|uniref:Uncharacterized protein n=1 Tax=Menopon gallinae TaxID=328185 RepID=A0AAW2IB56_9NEOP